MSRKSARIVKKEAVPRQMQAIQQHYQELCLKAGQIQYQISVLTKELAGINEQLLEVNKEAAKRNELDKEAQEQQKQQAEVKNEAT